MLVRLSIKTSSALSAIHRLSQSRCSLISTDKVFCGCFPCECLCQPPFGRISRNTQRPCYDTITVFDFCGTIGRAWIRTMHTRCSYACLPLSYRPPPIVCLQGLCRAYQYLSSHMAATAKHYHLQGFEYFGHCWKCHGKPTKHTIRQAIVSCLYLCSLLFFDDYYSEAFLWQLALCSSAILQICHERG